MSYINVIEVNGRRANDLRDQRALLIDELSKSGAVKVTERVIGDDVGISSYIVRINGQIIVEDDHVNNLICVPRKEKINQMDIDGLFDIANPCSLSSKENS